MTTLKRRATQIISDLQPERGTLLITQHGRPAAYLVDIESFEAMQRRMAIIEGIARGERALDE